MWKISLLCFLMAIIIFFSFFYERKINMIKHINLNQSLSIGHLVWIILLWILTLKLTFLKSFA